MAFPICVFVMNLGPTWAIQDDLTSLNHACKTLFPNKGMTQTPEIRTYRCLFWVGHHSAHYSRAVLSDFKSDVTGKVFLKGDR